MGVLLVGLVVGVFVGLLVGSSDRLLVGVPVGGVVLDGITEGLVVVGLLVFSMLDGISEGKEDGVPVGVKVGT